MGRGSWRAVPCGLLLAACGGGEDEPSPSSGGTCGVASASVPALEWSACPTASLECATFEVPLDYGDPSGEKIALDVIRRRAGDPSAREGVLLWHSGGPRATAKDVVPTFSLAEGAFPELSNRRDFLAVSLRGTSDATRVECGGPFPPRQLDLTPEDDSEWQALDDYFAAVAEDCLANTPAERIAKYDNDRAACDYDRLLAALGEQEAAYLGMSFGTAVGAALLDGFPERVSTAVLDAPLHLGEDGVAYWVFTSRAVEAEFVRAAERCSTNPTCAFHPGESTQQILAAFDVVAASLDGTPAESDVMLLAVKLGEGGDEDAFWAALAAAEQGDSAPVEAAAADNWNARTNFGPTAIAVNDIPCPEGFDLAQARAAYETVRAESPHVAPSQMAYWPMFCLHWPIHAEPQTIEKSTANPALIVAGKFDVVTAFAGGAEMQAGLDNGSYLLDHDTRAHVGFFSNLCVQDAEVAFLLDSSTPPPTHCDTP